MILASERKSPYRLYWVYKNPDVYTHPYSLTLKRDWDEVVRAVSEDRQMVILLDRHDEVGGLIPADMFYAAHLTGNQEKLFPVAHVEVSDFRDNPEKWVEPSTGQWNYLTLRENLMLLQDGKPQCALVTTLFFWDLNIEEDHTVRFTNQVYNHIYNPREPKKIKARILTPEEEKKHQHRKEVADKAWERLEEEHARPMDQANTEILGLVVSVLKGVKRTPKDIKEAVEKLSIEL